MTEMPRVQLQFHATPNEALQMTLEWAQEYGFHAVVERFAPTYRAEPIRETHLTSGHDEAGIDRVALCIRPPVTSAESAHQFASLNAGCLFVSVGPRTEDALRESAVGGVTDEPELLRTWRAVIQKARKSMAAGAVARDPGSGATSDLPRHPYTEGARRLADDGVRMLPAAGWVEYQFGQTSDDG